MNNTIRLSRAVLSLPMHPYLNLNEQKKIVKTLNDFYEKNKEHFHFTFTNIEKQYKKALDLGYNFITCKKFADNQNKLKKHTIVNRVDIDLSVKKAGRLGNIFNRLGIKGTFFLLDYTNQNIIPFLLKIIE